MTKTVGDHFTLNAKHVLRTDYFPIFGVSPCTQVRILKLKATSYSTIIVTALHWLTDQLSNDHLTPQGQSEDIYILIFAVTLQPACHFSDGRLSWRGDSGVAWGSKPADWSINTAKQKASGPAAIQVQQGGPSGQLFFFLSSKVPASPVKDEKITVLSQIRQRGGFIM